MIEIRTTQVIVGPEGMAVFDEAMFTVTIVDEASGEFVEVSQLENKIRVDSAEWPVLREAINRMIKECRK